MDYSYFFLDKNFLERIVVMLTDGLKVCPDIEALSMYFVLMLNIEGLLKREHDPKTLQKWFRTSLNTGIT